MAVGERKTLLGSEFFERLAGNATITNAESYDIIAEVAANNLDTSNGVWLVHPTDAATLADTSKDSGSGTFVYENGRIDGRKTSGQVLQRHAKHNMAVVQRGCSAKTGQVWRGDKVEPTPNNSKH